MLSICKLEKKKKKAFEFGLVVSYQFLLHKNIKVFQSTYFLSIIVPTAGTKLIVKGLQHYGKVKKCLDTWL